MDLVLVKRCLVVTIIAFLLLNILPNFNSATQNSSYVAFNSLQEINPQSEDLLTPSSSLPDRLFLKTDRPTKTHSLNNSVNPNQNSLSKSAPHNAQEMGKISLQKNIFQNQTTLQLWKNWQQQLVDSDYQQLPIIGTQIAEKLRKHPDEQIYQELYDLATSSNLSVEQKAIVVDLLSDVATPESLSLLVQLTEQAFDTPLYIFVLQAIGRVGDNRWDGKYHEELSGILEKEWSKPEVTDPNYIGVLAKSIASIGAPSGIKTLVNTLTGNTKNNASKLQNAGSLSNAETTIKPDNLMNAYTAPDPTLVVNTAPILITTILDPKLTQKNDTKNSNLGGNTPDKNNATSQPSTGQNDLVNTNNSIITHPNDLVEPGNENDISDSDANLEKQSQSIIHLPSTTNPHAYNELNNCLNNPTSKLACSVAPALVNSIIPKQRQPHLRWLNAIASPDSTATLAKARTFVPNHAQPLHTAKGLRP